MFHRVAPFALLTAAALLTACDGSNTPDATREATPTTAAPDTTPTADAWLLAALPADAQPVGQVKPDAKEGDSVIVRGRIGGRSDPMTAGSPVFIMMDASVPSCADTPTDNCPTPWDYCCESAESVAANNATVQLVDASGAPLAVDLIAAGFSPLDEVVVVGTVGPRPSPAVLTIEAVGIHLVRGG